MPVKEKKMTVLSVLALTAALLPGAALESVVNPKIVGAILGKFI